MKLSSTHIVLESSKDINTSLSPLILFFKNFNNGKGPNFK